MQTSPQSITQSKTFNPIKYACNNCEDVIYSRREGEYVTCQCGSIAVDQTRYYMRLIGKPENFIKVENDTKR